MAAFSYRLYQTDGIVETFDIPFPYLLQEHISVTVNGIFAVYTWESSSLIRITPTPDNGAWVDISRNSSIEARIVDFVNGSTLGEADMDLSALQNFYLAQEAVDKFTRYLEPALIKIVNDEGIIVGEEES